MLCVVVLQSTFKLADRRSFLQRLDVTDTNPRMGSLNLGHRESGDAVKGIADLLDRLFGEISCFEQLPATVHREHWRIPNVLSVGR